MKKKPILIGGAVLLVALIVTGMAMRGRGDKAPEVQSAKVGRQKIVQKVSATGKKDWRAAADRCVHHARAARFPQSMDHSLYKGPLGAALLELELEAPDDSLAPIFD